ncbi:MAG: efflux RND transporter periplasmic adaptor subunit [Planctomyces sp.]|nr:efflux RND transporter periplasmic adaptor subunit [Planctomyces sp.]
MRVQSLSVFLFAVCVGCGGARRESEQAGKPLAEQEAPRVEVVSVEPLPWRRTIRSQGSFAAEEFAVVGAKVAGRIEQTLVDLGGRVTAGMVVAKLDQADFKTRVAQSEATLLQACAAIGLKSADNLDAVNRENSPVVRQEKALLSQARANLARAERLRAQDAVAVATIDEFQAALDVAEARYQSSLNAVEERIATIRIRKAELDLALQELAETEILAPFAGSVHQRHVAPGTFVSIGDAIVTIVRNDPIRYRGQVPERSALQLNIGQPLTVRLENDEHPCTTTIARISPVVDELTRSLTFEADLPNPDGRYRVGMFAVGDVEVDPNATTIAIPLDAVTEFAGVERVWTVTDGEARQVLVRTGERQSGFVEIVSGLQTGDQIVLNGKSLRAGPVQVTGTTPLTRMTAALDRPPSSDDRLPVTNGSGSSD